jgi:hypothetical protein
MADRPSDEQSAGPHLRAHRCPSARLHPPRPTLRWVVGPRAAPRAAASAAGETQRRPPLRSSPPRTTSLAAYTCLAIFAIPLVPH